MAVVWQFPEIPQIRVILLGFGGIFGGFWHILECVPPSNLGPGTIQIINNLNIKEHLNRCFFNVYSVVEAVLMNEYFI